MVKLVIGLFVVNGILNVKLSYWRVLCVDTGQGVR